MALTIANTAGVQSYITGGATAVAPAANALIVSFTLPAGNSDPASYALSIVTGQQGTVDTNYTNILVNVGGSGNPVTGGTTYGPLTSLSLANGGAVQQVRLLIPAGGALVNVCVGNTAGGAGSIYVAGITATRLYSTGGLWF